MKLTQLRNATILIESKDLRILVDPSFTRKGTLPPFRLFTWPWRMNPLVELPANPSELMEGVTHCLITHRHPDHLDKKGIELLKHSDAIIMCSQADARALVYKDLNPVVLATGEEVWYPWGTVKPVPARHGPGVWGKLMGSVVGYILRFHEGPCLYLASDTILIEQVRETLREEKPDYSVVPAGGARFDIGPEIIMGLDAVIEFARLESGVVIANHMDALDHCRVSRSDLRRRLAEEDLVERVLVPEDGESLIL